MIGYYIHHHGFGHLARAISITAQMNQPVTALTSLDIAEPHPFAAIVKLSRDDRQSQACEPTANGGLHWAPQHHTGYSARMHELAQWVSETKPDAVVVDVSVEVATFVRLLGIPIIVVALPGRRVDPPHQMVHRLADHIVAAWPEAFNEPTWLRTYRAKVSYVGGISRFDGRDRLPVSHLEHRYRLPQMGMTVLVLAGASDQFGTALDEYRSALPGCTWTTLGGMSGTWTSDPWQQICSADVVITHAGQGSIADVAAARRPAVVIPQPRPFDEQLVTAQVLQKHRLAVVAGPHSDLRAVPALVTHARETDTQRWLRWQTDGAAGRAAAAIVATAQRCKGVAS